MKQVFFCNRCGQWREVREIVNQKKFKGIDGQKRMLIMVQCKTCGRAVWVEVKNEN